MFSFLFKRKNSKSAASHEATEKHSAAASGGSGASSGGGKHGASVAPKQANAQAQEQQRLQQQEKKQAALQQAASVANDETAAVSFILQCDFADARLQAAQHIQSKAALEQVLAGTRNLDRRVAKLMQQRLEALQYQQQSEGRAQAALEQAEKLLAQPLLMTSHLSELDKVWAALGKLPAEMPQVSRFTQVRADIAGRLQEQAQLQRRLIDLVAKLKACQLAPAVNAENADAEHAERAVKAEIASARQLIQELDALKEHRECAALPRQLMPEAEQEARRIMQKIQEDEQAQAALQACQHALQQWRQALEQAAVAEVSEVKEGADSASTPSDSAPALDVTQISKEWQTLLANCGKAQQAQLQVQFAEIKRRLAPIASSDAVASASPASVSTSPASASQSSPASQHSQTNPPREHHPRPAKNTQHALSKEELQAANTQFAQALHALEAALQEGSLQAAAENDKLLRDLKAVKPNGNQAGRLTALRAELHRLQSWARWGGKVSREELTKAVEDLATQEMTVVELAKKVGSMRERWRSLDASAGPAPRQLWERFDQACTTAYAPAAEHFKKLAAERAQHAQQAQDIIGQVQAFVQAHPVDTPQPDWRAIASFCQKVDQQWHRLGSIERKERKRLDKEFAQALAVLLQPLEQQRAIEVRRREELIAEVEQLDSHERGALDHLRHLQERWQEMAKALPLARKVEQELWQRFHAGCDAVFAQRKESAHQEQAERRQHLQAKEALCLQLEQVAAEETNKALRELLKNTRQAWKEIGPVPRAQEVALDKRWQQAQESIAQKIDAQALAAQKIQNQAQLEKLLLCIALENALQSGAQESDVWNSRWAALPKVAAELEKVLNARWQNAIAAANDDVAREKLLSRLQAKRADLANEVLRQEIIHGIDSPAEFSRERLQMQVQVLQSSLKSGEKQGFDAGGGGGKLALYSAALVDDALLARVKVLLA
ncbi:MAG: DUF349 domain-containing protein [Burkholderiales bacterium]|nr:DUF349 domain-containing protein [Burkholderiales bacterium]